MWARLLVGVGAAAAMASAQQQNAAASANVVVANTQGLNYPMCDAMYDVLSNGCMPDAQESPQPMSPPPGYEVVPR